MQWILTNDFLNFNVSRQMGHLEIGTTGTSYYTVGERNAVMFIL